MGYQTIKENGKIKFVVLPVEEFNRLLEKIDDETLLIIISDHGFTSFEQAVSINTWLVEKNLMKLNGEILEGESGALFRNVNWKKTKAYSLGFNSIYLNLKNREKDGVISQEEKEEIVFPDELPPPPSFRTDAVELGTTVDYRSFLEVIAYLQSSEFFWLVILILLYRLGRLCLVRKD